MCRSELVDAINSIEPDDYSDWSIEELQEFAINLGIPISRSTFSFDRSYFEKYLNHRAPRSDSNMSYNERLQKEFAKNANK